MENATDFENIGKLIDELENLTYALNLQLPDGFHVVQFRTQMPRIVQKLKTEITLLAGYNPWENSMRFSLNDEKSPF